MKRFILLLLTIFTATVAFAETNVTVMQSVQYPDGMYYPVNTPQISIEGAKLKGGKVYFKYDFVVSKILPLLKSDDIVILVKFPKHVFGDGSWNSAFLDEYLLKVTSLSGAHDLTKDILRDYSGTEHYTIIQKAIGRLPRAFPWYISDGTCTRESLCCIPLVMENKKGNTASLEFYIDIGAVFDSYQSLDGEEKSKFSWIEDVFHEIPIDITFHDWNCITAWNYYSDSKYEYDSKSRTAVKNSTVTGFCIVAKDFYSWQNTYSKSNHQFTIMVRE